MSAVLPPDHDASEAVAVAAERRWAAIVLAISALLVLMMVITGLHWVARSERGRALAVGAA